MKFCFILNSHIQQSNTNLYLMRIHLDEIWFDFAARSPERSLVSKDRVIERQGYRKTELSKDRVIEATPTKQRLIEYADKNDIYYSPMATCEAVSAQHSSCFASQRDHHACRMWLWTVLKFSRYAQCHLYLAMQPDAQFRIFLGVADGVHAAAVEAIIRPNIPLNTYKAFSGSRSR